jgi:hypothetical protein
VPANFPPRSTHNREIEILLTFLQSVINDRNAVYVSSPITSGRRYIKWVKEHPLNSNFSGDNQNPEFISNVIEKNLDHAKSVVQKMRSAFSGSVLIDPTAVPDIENWKQDDYRYAWGRIIERFAKTLVCSDDWQFSSGCAYEYLVAKNAGIQIFDERLEELSTEKARQLLLEAKELMRSHGLGTNFQEAVYAELSESKTAEGQF